MKVSSKACIEGVFCGSLFVVSNRLLPLILMAKNLLISVAYWP